MTQLIFEAALLSAVLLLWLPLLSELLCLVTRHTGTGRSLSSPGAGLPRLLFLVPAHDEELLIGGCVRSLLDVKFPRDKRRVIVIADNCSDATGRIAREQGAECFERSDAAFPGKPRAIAWALSQIDLHEWDACVVVDADSTVAPEFASGIAELAPLNDIVFQANFGVLNEFDGWLTRLGGLLSRCRYDVTYPLKQSAGLNCPITGNGMGFGANLLIRDGWRSFSITEDSELYAIYTEAGTPIRHASNATLFSQEASSLRQGAVQRRRWLGGRLRVVRDWGWRLIRSRNIGWHQKVDAFVELGLSSPVLHLIAAVSVGVIAFVALPTVRAWPILVLAGASLSGLGITTVIAVWHHPQPWRTIFSFALLPLYAVWRLVVLIATMFTLRDNTWRRTARTAPRVPIINPNS
ncbi:MAG TPA: glycosyltransferase [Gemmatimonadaceae bacterium]